jgi:zinc transport system substrate-binding protein
MAAAAPPRVAVSIAPLQMVAAAVMQGAGEPVLLLPPGQSPHHGAFKPSQARVLDKADLVVWIGPLLEAAVDKALDARPADWVAAHALTVSELPGLTVHSFRHLDEIGDGHADHDHAAEGKGEPDHHHHAGDLDPHLWLDPDNAAVIARALAERLADKDAEHAALYRANAAGFVEALNRLKADLAAQLAGAKDKGFVVFHDAYQYFELPFGLAAVAALTVDPSRPVAGRHLTEVREAVRAKGAVCVFADAQASQAAVDNLAGQLGIRSAVLDPLGVGIPPSADGYPQLLRNLAASFRGCLEK